MFESAADKPRVYGIRAIAPAMVESDDIPQNMSPLGSSPPGIFIRMIAITGIIPTMTKFIETVSAKNVLFNRREIVTSHHGFHKQRLKYEESHHESRQVLDDEVDAVRKPQMKCDNSAEY